VYVGGKKEWPTYRSIGDHTEGVMVTYDMQCTSFDELLDYYYAEHDPFGRSWGRQYMDGVWWHNEEQRAAIALKVAAIEAAAVPGSKVRSWAAQLTPMYRAEEYHQQYFAKQASRGGWHHPASSL